MQRQQIRWFCMLLAFLLFPAIFYLFSPVIILFGASQGIIAGSFLTFGLLFISSLILGRAFCGWACGAGGFQEICFKVRDTRLAHRWIDAIKYLIWVPWIAATVLLFFKAGGIAGVEPWLMMKHGLSLSGPESYIVYFLLLGLIMMLALLVGRRAFCHTVCWMAPFMIIGSKLAAWMRWPRLHLAAQKERCTHCKLCTQSCPMSLDVERMVASSAMAHAECTLCGTCVDRCPTRTLSYTFSQ